MEKFSAEEFYQIGEDLGRMAQLFDSGDERTRVNEINQRGDLQIRIARIMDLCETLDLKVSVTCADEFLERIDEEDFTTGNAHGLFKELSNTIRREMQTVLFFHLPSSQAEFYGKKDLFGKEVLERFFGLQYDIEEAGNCLALGRGTACVFHLMRVMEATVQDLAMALDVKEVCGKTVRDAAWHNILDAINKAIKPRPEKNETTVILNEAAANLYSVKVAWRNQVMHPKATYTVEEAEDVLRQVKGFMRTMAKLNLPVAGSSLIQ